MSPGYNYPTAAEQEERFVKDHRRHRVIASPDDWLRCWTCGALLKVTTQPVGPMLKRIEGLSK